MDVIGYSLALLVGISLGLIGGGGSILAMPILVYIFNFQPQLATSYSLFIVGLSASIGTLKHYKLKNINLITALLFGIPSSISLLLIRSYFLPTLPENLFNFGKLIITKNIFIMLIFALLMIAASTSMIKKTKKSATLNKPNNIKLATIGFATGIVTGFLGAGGGFLIIPALIFFAALPMKQAIGTSLFIIALNASIGFIGDVLNNVTLNWPFLGLFTAIAIIGIFLGTHISKKIDGNKLKPAFGWFILVAGTYIIVKEIFL